MRSCNLKFSKSFYFCSSCQLTKSHRLPFILSESKAMKPIYSIHYDLWGPSPILFVTGARYFLLFIDDYSRYTWFYLLKSKDVVFSYFLKFKNLIEKKINTTIKALQTDWSGEFGRLSLFLKILVFIIAILVIILPNKMGELSAKIVMLLKLACPC